ncbi:hypothetical protein [Glutamicibacter halophytocola]|uniref:hypothetical protein n=1 Tax=Glutamicibacter halophytocola TaxID=1933880 RepID=UPI001892AF37|nr:hypothetical protein [Glutamicibacter halophytocola]
MSKPAYEDLPKCTECERPMRPRKYKSKEYPKTMAMGNYGMCNPCTKTKREAENGRGNDPQTLRNKQNLEVFLNRISADRRRMEQRRKVHMVIR